MSDQRQRIAVPPGSEFTHTMLVPRAIGPPLDDRVLVATCTTRRPAAPTLQRVMASWGTRCDCGYFDLVWPA
jgi:hypothetical protein